LDLNLRKKINKISHLVKKETVFAGAVSFFTVRLAAHVSNG